MQKHIIANVHAWNAEAMRRRESEAASVAKKANNHNEPAAVYLRKDAERYRANCDRLETLM